LSVLPENRLLRRGILQASELGAQRRRRIGRQSVNHPLAAPLGFHHAAPAQVSEMTRDLGLRFAEDFLEMTHAQRPVQQQMDKTQPRAVAKALVDADKIHSDDIYA
jgi:hypothetical protein